MSTIEYGSPNPSNHIYRKLGNLSRDRGDIMCCHLPVHKTLRKHFYHYESLHRKIWDLTLGTRQPYAPERLRGGRGGSSSFLFLIISFLLVSRRLVEGSCFAVRVCMQSAVAVAVRGRARIKELPERYLYFQALVFS